MATLDKSKDFGISCGDPTHAFVQDGKLFNAQGKEVDATGKLVAGGTKTEITPPDGKKKKLTEAEEQLAAQAKA
jgi:hypothetical protein